MATQDYGWSQIAARAGLAWPEAVPWAMQCATQAGFAAWEPFLRTAADARRIGQQAVDHGLAMPPEQQIASVTADGAFDTRKCHEAIAARSAAAMIPPRKNAKR